MGMPANNLTWAHKIIVVFLIRVACTHNLPSLVVPIKEHAVRPSQGHPIPVGVAALESSIQWNLINDEGIYPQATMVITDT